MYLGVNQFVDRTSNNLSGSFTDQAELSDVDLMLRSLRWPSDFVFPCLDLTRLIVLNPVVMDRLTSVEEATSG
jgi:hypothetical protein